MENQTMIIYDYNNNAIEVPAFNMSTHRYDFATCQIVELSLFERNNFLEQIEAAKSIILRQQREQECFPIINRGLLWHETLLEQQKYELRAWYAAWLDAPQTKHVPQKPMWLK